MRLGLDTAQHQLSWPQLLARVRFAEELAFDGIWLFDHFKALYGDPTGPCLEAWTLLGALAAATDHIRLGTLVTGITYRYPSILATQAVTVDHVSNGRLELAVGAAWFEDEHRELGIPFPAAGQRATRLDEAITIMRRLMTSDTVNFEGRYYRLDHATYRPRPVQQPHPPIWIGASGEQRMLPIVGRQADVWHAYGDVTSLKRKSAIVDEAARRAGRDPSSIMRSSSLSLEGSWDQVRRQAEGLRDIGFTYLICGWPSDGEARIRDFADHALPHIAAL